MKHIISLVSDGHIQFALADGDELTQFARIMVPERFGLEQAALLGTNLIDVLGLRLNGHTNGHAKPEALGLPRIGRPRTSNPAEAHQRKLVLQREWRERKKQEAAAEARVKVERLATQMHTVSEAVAEPMLLLEPGPPAKTKRGNPYKNGRKKSDDYIALEQIEAVVNEHPGGLTNRQVAEILFPGIKLEERHIKQVANRVDLARQAGSLSIRVETARGHDGRPTRRMYPALNNVLE